MGLFINNTDNATYRIFNYSTSLIGGTEMTAQYVLKNIVPKLNNLKKYNCFIVPGILPPDKTIIESKKRSIVWIHSMIEEFSSIQFKSITNKDFLDKFDYIINVSEFQKQATIKELGIDPKKVVVINNGITPLSFNNNKFNNVDKVKIIHSSSPDRGMVVLLKSLKYIDEDFDLEIYNNYYPDVANPEDADVIASFSDPRVKFYGLTPRKTLYKALANAHIYAYPAIHLETFCISQVEAMSAGLIPVYNERGSLPEVSGEFGVRYDASGLGLEEHAKLFAKHLSETIKLIKNNSYDPSEQIQYINNKFSWKTIEQQWLDFNNKL